MSKFNEEQRVELTKKIADYIIETKSSTRKSADKFKISNATISTWMNEILKKIDLDKYNQVQEILNGNKPKTIADDSVYNRVIKVAELIEEGFTVKEIAKALGQTDNVINEDLQTRLPRISKELYEQIRSIQSKNSINNLKNVNRG